MAYPGYPSNNDPQEPASPYGPPPSYPPAYGDGTQPAGYGTPPPYGTEQPPPAQPPYGQPAYTPPPTSAQPAYGQPASGQPAYGQPASGQPAYGQPVYGQPPVFGPPAKQGTNGFAIASLIFGILGGVLFAVIFGIVALTQIPKRNQGGKGLAITGLVLSVVWLLVCGGAIAIGALSDKSTGTTGNDGLTTSQTSDLKVGDCVNGINGKDGTQFSRNPPKVACTTPHEGEVFKVITMADGSFPGDTEVQKQSEDGCGGALDSYAPAAKTDKLEIYFLYPTRSSWLGGDRDITCFAVSEGDKIVGPLNG
ncbi:DUF4190 domain-containing protein [Hamadaea tsunoensis]|uniref:DUF4190 domain-containing protein n=1 Tax=Hamadaea tsunoensis TaxID=53368 RepID=UPI0003FFA00A|nr:DUF4190 domain-containing protein [Hamadaea tsunoensis]